MKNVDLGLAALTNGAARPDTDATPQYRQAADEARRNRRGIFQRVSAIAWGMAMTTSRTWILALVPSRSKHHCRLRRAGLAPECRRAGIGAVAGGVTGGLIARRAGST